MESSGEELAFHIELQEMQKKKKKREKEEETRQHTLFESSDRADCKNRRGSPLRDPPAVNTSALCHDKYLFRCSYHAGLLAMSH